MCVCVQHMWIIQAVSTSLLAPATKKRKVWKTEERKTQREECVSGTERQRKTWKKRECRKCDLTSGDSRCYTWTDSLPLQLYRPHAQYDFTTSSPSLEIPFFIFLHAAPSPSPLLSICSDAILTERQVKSLVTCLFPTPVSGSLWLQLASRA